MGERFRTAKFYLMAIFTATLNMRLRVNMLLFSIACRKLTLRSLAGSGLIPVKLFYKYEENTITVLSGKHTGRNGVVSATAPSGHKVDVTSLERTLIDITVRPGYAGDVPAVLEAFRLAKNQISVSKLTALLRRLDYTYPYHQSIGFYLKRAGYPESDQLLAKREPIEFDFYLSHNLKDPDFDPEWRVFFPRSLK
jgi:hypothetical protein